MIASIFTLRYARRRHKDAPFLHEREAYLTHMQASGRTKQQIQQMASIMLHFIRVLPLTEWRCVDKAEIKEAAHRWSREEMWQRRVHGRKSAVYRFTSLTQKWLRFHNALVMPKRPEYWFDPELAAFQRALSLTGLTAVTCERYLRLTGLFLRWLATRRTSIRTITVADVDQFIEERIRANFSPYTIENDYQALRSFFRYAETRSWCEFSFYRALRPPIHRKPCSESRGPTWQEIRRIIASCDRDTVSELRARAILLLCSIYGLRNSEVTGLCLKDFDWESEIMTVRRSKSGRIQQFPIQYEVGEAIIKYLRQGRPQASCRNLFMSQYPPYRPLRKVWKIISRRIKKLKISSKNFGPHALRHACATELLRKGASLPELADFLGHQTLSSVHVYAKHDLRSLREVAKISLAGVL